MHDATKVLMGTTQSSDRTVDSKVGSLPAGTIVRLKSDGTLSKAAADGEALGISLGKDLSDTDKIAIVRRGLKVPLLLTDSFEPTVGAQVTIDDVTGIGKAAGSGVTGVNATFASGVLTGIAEDGTEVDVALIDMPGGL
jgi:hypothetical protein